MSLFREMLQAAHSAPKLLGDSADLVRAFLVRQQNPDGGFKDRSGKSDVYYTMFGLAGLAALKVKGWKLLINRDLERAADRAARYLRLLPPPEDLDWVSVCCLARVRAILAAFGMGAADWSQTKGALLDRIESHRCVDGGYHPAGKRSSGTVYGAFLAFGVYQDMQVAFPEPQTLAASVQALAVGDGSWMNELAASRLARGPLGSTNATAAAVSVLRQLGHPAPGEAGPWLRARFHPQGGFLAAPSAPLPDLLSTATALHALASLRIPYADLRDRCLDYVDTLWTNEGGFYGHWGDDHLDCEYTFYGLLALGRLT